MEIWIEFFLLSESVGDCFFTNYGVDIQLNVVFLSCRYNYVFLFTESGWRQQNMDESVNHRVDYGVFMTRLVK